MDAQLEPPAKKKKGSKGNPPGIFDHNSGDKQARLLGIKVDGKAYQRPNRRAMREGLFHHQTPWVAASRRAKI